MNKIFSGKFCVEILDLRALVEAIKQDLERNNLHQLESLDIKKLIEIDQRNQEQNEANYPRHFIPDPGMELGQLSVELYSIFGRLIDYYNPLIPVSPISPQAIKQVSNLREKYKREIEYRLEFNTSAFASNGSFDPKIINLIKYIKLRCPGIGKYLRAVGKVGFKEPSFSRNWN